LSNPINGGAIWLGAQTSGAQMASPKCPALYSPFLLELSLWPVR